MNIRKFGCAVAVAVIPAVAHAGNYQASTWIPSAASTVSVTYEKFLQEVEQESKREMTFTLHSGGALLPPAETLKGVSDGVAVVGDILSAYTPADLPLNNVLGDMGFLQVDPIETAFAAAEVKFKNNRLQQEWLGHGIVFGGNWSSSSYHLRCVPEVKNLNDIKGKRIRTSVGSQIDFLKSVGANPVSVPASEVYSGLERGTLDCAMASDEILIALRTGEVVDYTTFLPMGVFIDGAAWGYNRDFWVGIGSKNRRILLDNMAEYMVHTQLALLADDRRGAEDAKGRGVKWINADADLVKALETFQADFLTNLPAAEMEKRNVEDPSDIIQDFLEARKKWRGLLAGVDRSDSKALIALLKSELYDKIDETTYGVK